MDMKVCRICGKQDDNYIHIFKTEGLKNKIETCLPIVITNQYPLPDIICNPCLDSVDNFYSFIKNCLQNIIVLEAQCDIIESCLKTKRKVDKSVTVSDSDFPIDDVITSLEPIKSEFVINFNLNDVKRTKDSPIPNFTCGLVDYDSSDDNYSDYEADHRKPIEFETVKIEPVSEPNNIINEIAQRKYLKRKNEDASGGGARKMPRLDSESSSRRKSKQPKRIEYHREASSPKIETVIAPIMQTYTTQDDDDNAVPDNKLLNLPAEISVTREEPKVPTDQMQTCLLCEQQFFGPVPLTTHMYETHGIDLTQVFAAAQQPPPPPQQQEKPPKKKIPELVKISDVMNVRKQLPQENYDEPPVLEPQGKLPAVSVLTKSHYTCPDCDESSVYKTFKEYSNHRRSQHQIFHCDLCPKFYGRNSHLWKHVNRVHKGHPSITCQQCYKTSASKYHLAQHFNKMHSVKGHASKATRISSSSKSNSGYATPDENDDEFMNQKFQGFDFKSVRQSFLRQDMIDKQQKYVSILKRGADAETPKLTDPKNFYSDSESNDSKAKNVSIKSAPKEIDSSSNLYTNIITNYTPPLNEGAFKCPKCFKGFHKKNLLKKHKKNCRPRLQKDLLTRCKTCSRIFKDRQSLAKHLINYHSEYTCEICNLAVQSKCEIVSHIRFSHPNSELTCHCGQILRSKSDLQKHKMDHRDSHVCQFCGDMLPTKIKLKMHILSLHRKILSLSCGICLKLFETQHILRDHVRLVHGDQLSPLTSCTVCGKNYGSKWKTYDHLNKSHGRIFKACKACLEVFETEQDLQKHFEVDHLNAKNNSAEKKHATVEKKEEGSPETNERMQDFIRGEHQYSFPERVLPDGNSSSESEDGETSGESSGVQNNPKTLQDDTEYRNYVIREFHTNLEKKTGQNGLGIKELKKSDGQRYHDAKLSLLEKRLLGKKLTDDNNDKPKNSKKITMTSDNVTENGGNKEKKKAMTTTTAMMKHEKYDEDPMQNSSKRTVYVNSNDPSLCEICLKVWPAKKHLWQHYIRCHKQVAATVCGICLKTNPSYSSLQRHLRETHPNLLYGCGFGSNFICKICGRYHNASSKLKLHMAIHVGFNENLLEDFKDIKSIPPINEDNNKPQTEEETSEEELEQVETIEHTIEIQENDDDLIKLEEVKEELVEEIVDDELNYESLIEEVEVSSESENEEYENEEYNQVDSSHDNNYGHEEQVYAISSPKSEEQDEAHESEQSDHDMSSSSEDDEGVSDAEESENEVTTENELEQEMLKNMIGENVTIVNKIKDEDMSDTNSYQSDEEENGEGEGEGEKRYEKVKVEMCSSDDWTNSPQFLQTIKQLKREDYQRKELELDNAIKSIAYDSDNIIVDYSNMNENELETAVGSIL